MTPEVIQQCQDHYFLLADPVGAIIFTVVFVGTGILIGLASK